ncbi:hypothetical protein H6G45_06455 [Synechocystis sp. FACHB-383]|uniref:hypothetical protein n=1 Tax=Synechocystis sp. FACHB-383 TaxID=2692864 RepID=UPI001688EBE8|nr:hypothetical protein [Synechocystis sp. FACHB-383]MBD2653134.1 hypothetical protein [Synechocystis sp. FACHB-383]
MNQNYEKKGELWESQAEAVRLTGLPRRTLKEWIDKGKISQSKSGYVNVIEVFQKNDERKQREIDRLKGNTEENPQKRLTLAQCRKIEAEAKLREFELRRLEGELLPLAEAIADFETALIAAKSKLLALPTRLSLQLSGLDNPREISQVLEDVICEALAALSAEFAEAEE